MLPVRSIRAVHFICAHFLLLFYLFFTAEIQKADTTHAAHARSQRQRTDPRRTEMIRSVNAVDPHIPSIRTNSQGPTHFRGKLRPKLSHQTKTSWTLRARLGSLTERRLPYHISSATLYYSLTDPTIDHLLQTPIHKTGEDRMARLSSLSRSLGGLATLLALLGLGGVRGAYRRPKTKCGPDPFYRAHTCIYTCTSTDRTIQPTNQPINLSRPTPQPPQNHAQPTSSTASCPTIPRPRTRWACGTTRR